MTNRAFDLLMKSGEFQLHGWMVNELKHYELRLRQVGLDGRYEDVVMQLMREKVSQWLKECE